MNAPASTDFRRLTARDLPGILALICELRPHLDLAMLTERFTAQELLGYELHAAVVDGKVVALAGFRPVVTLSRGRYLHLDDLVVAASHQGQGTGRLLLDHIEGEAKKLGNAAVVLDARPSAIPFYERCQYAPHPSPSYWKALKT